MSKFEIVNIKSLFMFCVLYGFLTQVQAANELNYLELATAVAQLPAEISEKCCAKNVKRDPVKVALWHTISKSISVVNKSLSLYNGVNSQMGPGFIDIKNRDLVFKCMVLLCDLVKLGKNANAYRHERQEAHRQKMNKIIDEFGLDEADDSGNEDSVLNKEDQTVEVEDKAENLETNDSSLSKISYYAGIPSLKALASVAVAFTQEGFTRYSGHQSRNLATSAQTFVYLLDGLSELDESNATYKKVFYVALAINAVWFAYELKQCFSNLGGSYNADLKCPDFVIDDSLLEAAGECPLCFRSAAVDGISTLAIGNCGHRYCKDCFEFAAKEAINGNTFVLSEVKCPGCKAEKSMQGKECPPLSREEINRITGGAFVKKYDVFYKAFKMQEKRDLAIFDDFIQNFPGKNAAFCPGKTYKKICGNPCVRTEHCAHLTCKACKHGFCVHCLGDYPSGYHACNMVAVYGICTPNPLSDCPDRACEVDMLAHDFNFEGYAYILGYASKLEFARDLENFINKHRERLTPNQIDYATRICDKIRHPAW